MLSVERNENECGVQQYQEDQDHFDEVLMLPAQPHVERQPPLIQGKRVCSQAGCWSDPADG